jgi:hypothetical protein
MAKFKFIKNDLVHWIVVVIMIGGILYNAITNTAIIKNELIHLKDSVKEVNQRIERIEEFLWYNK